MKNVEWKLPSGTWQSNPSAERDSFVRIDMPKAVQDLSQQQQQLIKVRGVFPPEFRFDPKTGAALPDPAPVIQWTTPDGGNAINDNYLGFGIDAVSRFSGLDTNDVVTMDSPGHGQWEFIVGTFNTDRPQLIAINVRDYALKIRLADSWVELHCHSDAIPERFAAKMGWRAELFESRNEPSRLFVPAGNGLYVLTIDAATLSYECAQVRPDKFARLCGSPMSWLNGVLFPYVDADGHVALARIADAARYAEVSRLDLAVDQARVVDSRLQFQVAVSRKNRLAVWIADDNVLQLNRSWQCPCMQSLPNGYHAAFESLRPFVDVHSGFWLLVKSTDGIQYVHLGSQAPDFEMQDVERIYLSAGQRFFRKDMAFGRNNPWTDSNHEQDSQSSEHHFPLVDFFMSADRTTPAEALTLNFDTRDSVHSWQDLYQDDSREMYFRLCLGHSELDRGRLPGLVRWTRVFIYQSRLWFYCAPGKPLRGWRMLE